MRRTSSAFAACACLAFAVSAHAQDDLPKDPEPPTPVSPPSEPEHVSPDAAPAPPDAPLEPTKEAPRPVRDRDANGFSFGGVSFLGTRRMIGRYYEGGPFFGLGGPMAFPGLATPIGLSGVRVLENHGYISKWTVSALVALVMSLAGDKRVVGTETSTTYSGDEHFGTKTTTTTTYYEQLSPQEIEARNRAPGEAFGGDYVMELDVYAPGLFGTFPGRPQARGFEYYLGSQIAWGKKRPVVLQLGFEMGFLHVPDALFEPGQGPNGDSGAGATTVHAEQLKYTNVGMFLNLQVPVLGPVLELIAHLDLNIINVFGKGSRVTEEGQIYSSPLRVGALLNLTDRIYARAFGTLNALTDIDKAVGWVGEFGVRL